jgi:hypothetical protein
MLMKHRSFHSFMRIDALITIILIETVCIISLMYYLVAKIFSWDTRISQEDATAALLIGVLSLAIYGIFALVNNFFLRKSD